MLRRRKPLHTESVESEESFSSNTSSNLYQDRDSKTVLSTGWSTETIRDYFNYKSESDDNDDYIDKLVDEQIERLSKPKIVNSNTCSKIFAITFVIFVIILILFLAIILALEANDLSHPFYMHLLKLLQYFHYTLQGKLTI